MYFKNWQTFFNWGTVKTVIIMKVFLMLVTKRINAIKAFAQQDDKFCCGAENLPCL